MTEGARNLFRQSVQAVSTRARNALGFLDPVHFVHVHPSTAGRKQPVARRRALTGHAGLGPLEASAPRPRGTNACSGAN
jgi:hypothetical protein